MLTRLSRSFQALAFPIITACPIFANETPDLEPHHAAIETITLFAGTPDIVTPVGVAVAPDGRGLEVGPDLTPISRQAGGGRKWLLTHVLDPNAEVAPYFRPQVITTKDGQTRMGFILGREGKAQSDIGPDGKTFSVLKTDVTAREEVSTSLMPPGLLMPMTSEEIRDLMGYILEGTD